MRIGIVKPRTRFASNTPVGRPNVSSPPFQSLHGQYHHSSTVFHQPHHRRATWQIISQGPDKTARPRHYRTFRRGRIRCSRLINCALQAPPRIDTMREKWWSCCRSHGRPDNDDGSWCYAEHDYCRRVVRLNRIPNCSFFVRIVCRPYGSHLSHTRRHEHFSTIGEQRRVGFRYVRHQTTPVLSSHDFELDA